MHVTVRRADPGDARELARLLWDFRPQDQVAKGLEDFSREFETWLVGALASGWIAPVAEDGSEALAGCIFLRSVGTDPGALHRSWGYVTNSYVAPDHRGHHRGCPGTGHEFLIVWPSEEAESSYARAGFREVTEVHGGLDDYPPLELSLT